MIIFSVVILKLSPKVQKFLLNIDTEQNLSLSDYFELSMVEQSMIILPLIVLKLSRKVLEFSPKIIF